MQKNFKPDGRHLAQHLVVNALPGTEDSGFRIRSIAGQTAIAEGVATETDHLVVKFWKEKSFRYFDRFVINCLRNLLRLRIPGILFRLADERSRPVDRLRSVVRPVRIERPSRNPGT